MFFFLILFFLINIFFFFKKNYFFQKKNNLINLFLKIFNKKNIILNFSIINNKKYKIFKKQKDDFLFLNFIDFNFFEKPIKINLNLFLNYIKFYRFGISKW